MKVLSLSRLAVVFSLTLYIASVTTLIVIGLQTKISIATLTTDPASIMNFPFYAGALSILGSIFWSMTAAICIFTAVIHNDRKIKSFLGLMGLLTFVLMLDDQFLIHEEVFPNYLGISSWFLYGFYAISLLLIFSLYFRLVFQTNIILLLLPLAMFAASVVSNSITLYLLTIVNPLLFEDGTKFIGIVGWFIYFCIFSQQSLRLQNSSDHHQQTPGFSPFQSTDPGAKHSRRYDSLEDTLITTSKSTWL